MTDIRANLGAQRLAAAQRRHRHDWSMSVTYEPDGAAHYADVCIRCHAIKDEAKSRLGKSAARRGKDREKYVEHHYGPVKVGQYGDAIDNLGAAFKWQVKTQRVDSMDAVPRWQRRLRGILPTRRREWYARPMAAMDDLHASLAPLLIKSWTFPGGSIDIIVVRRHDWDRLHPGGDSDAPYLAMTGDYFLAIHGRDQK